uniref:Glucose-methanol-choline oxidoreductase C-terminal domain-containing protein n=1 Tax=Daphnia galeata TaxID=27404 RepID=A0A8J2RGK6_9CRUS|nr:unnamed protein product [Daphnia galeata]
MGKATDPAAVVDARLRVYGIKRLKVVDVFIMPNVVSGNTNAPTIIIGERESGLIKEDWPHNKENVVIKQPMTIKTKFHEEKKESKE